MPYSAMKPCSYPGCNTLVHGSRCDLHKVTTYDKRDPERQRLYGYKWRKIRQAFISSNPWCEECLANGLYTPSVDVHHVDRHEGNATIFYSSRLQALCHSCHSKKTLTEIRDTQGRQKKFANREPTA